MRGKPRAHELPACTLPMAVAKCESTGNQGRVTGFVMTIDQTGARATTNAPSAWMPSVTNCFVTRKKSC